jgi:hypothetical protein
MRLEIHFPSKLPKATTSKPVAKHGELFEALARFENADPKQLTRPAEKSLGAALAEIKRACPALTVEEIERRGRHYAELWPTVRPTAHGLVKHWAQCDERPINPDRSTDRRPAPELRVV